MFTKDLLKASLKINSSFLWYTSYIKPKKIVLVHAKSLHWLEQKKKKNNAHEVIRNWIIIHQLRANRYTKKVMRGRTKTVVTRWPTCFGRRFDEGHVVAFGEAARLVDGHLTLVLQVELAADQDEDGAVRLDVVARLRHPDGHVLETLAAADVVDDQHAHRVAEVRLGDRPEPLLTGLILKKNSLLFCVCVCAVRLKRGAVGAKNVKNIQKMRNRE